MWVVWRMHSGCIGGAWGTHGIMAHTRIKAFTLSSIRNRSTANMQKFKPTADHPHECDSISVLGVHICLEGGWHGRGAVGMGREQLA